MLQDPIDCWSSRILRNLREPQIARGNGAEWQWMARQELQTGMRWQWCTGKGPCRISGTARGTESLFHIPPPKWWCPCHHSQNLLLNILLLNLLPNLFPNLLSNPLSNVLLLMSIDLHLSRSCLWGGIILPQVQQAVRICSLNSGDGSGVTGIFLVIFGFVGEIPHGCWMIWKILTGGDICDSASRNGSRCLDCKYKFEFDCELKECRGGEIGWGGCSGHKFECLRCKLV